jgi:hypothetical protein
MHVGYRAILVSCSQKKAWLHARRGSGSFIRSGTARWTSLYCLTAPPDVEGWALSRAVARSAQRTCLDLAACTRQVTAHGRAQYDAFGRGCSERPPTRTRLKWTSDVSFFFLTSVCLVYAKILLGESPCSGYFTNKQSTSGI